MPHLTMMRNGKSNQKTKFPLIEPAAKTSFVEASPSQQSASVGRGKSTFAAYAEEVRKASAMIRNFITVYFTIKSIPFVRFAHEGMKIHRHNRTPNQPPHFAKCGGNYRLNFSQQLKDSPPLGNRRRRYRFRFRFQGQVRFS